MQDRRTALSTSPEYPTEKDNGTLSTRSNEPVEEGLNHPAPHHDAEAQRRVIPHTIVPMNNLLVIHAHKDADAAAVLAQGIRRVSLGQLDPWFSSDTSSAGGLRPGEIWTQRLLAQLSTARIGIALITKNSASLPWLYFEAGHIAARESGLVIPVMLGVEGMGNLPGPLAMYQGFQLTDSISVGLFFSKLLSEFNIPFDDEMATVVIKKMLQKLATSAPILKTGETTPSDPHADLKAHFDRRMTTFTHALIDMLGSNSTTRTAYDVKIEIRFPDLESETFVRIEPDTIARLVLDNVFYALAGRVLPFTYLQNWILREVETGLKLVIGETAYFALASTLFPPKVVWRAEALDAPYDVTTKRIPSLVGPEIEVFGRQYTGNSDERSLATIPKHR